MAARLMIVRDPRARLRELAIQRKTSLGDLAVAIGRPRRYLTRFVREGRPERLSAGDLDQLSRFFGVSPVELGGDDPRWQRWKDHAFHTTERKLGFERKAKCG
jgi:transcriptional regulator with XRE-family HTH domain